MPVSPVHFDRRRIEERYADAAEDLPFFLESAESAAKNLPILIATATDVACCGIALEVDHRIVQDALSIAAHASAAIFMAASSEDLPIAVQLGDGHRCHFLARPDQSQLHASRWLRGFFLNAICRSAVPIQGMIEVPTELLRSSTTKDPEYRYLLVDALKALSKGDSQCNTILLHALDETDPQRSDIRSPNWTLNLDVPQMQLLYYVATCDNLFAEAFAKAIILHNQYWMSNSDRRNNWEGLFSIELTGLAAIARSKGLSFHVTSPCVPSWLAN